MENKKQGKGLYVYPNKDKYEGDFKMDKRWGYGIYFFEDGHVYQGNWEDDQENGQGSLTISSGKGQIQGLERDVSTIYKRYFRGVKWGESGYEF